MEEMISDEMQYAIDTGVVGATLKQISKCKYTHTVCDVCIIFSLVFCFVWHDLKTLLNIYLFPAHETPQDNSNATDEMSIQSSNVFKGDFTCDSQITQPIQVRAINKDKHKPLLYAQIWTWRTC